MPLNKNTYLGDRSRLEDSRIVGYEELTHFQKNFKKSTPISEAGA